MNLAIVIGGVLALFASAECALAQTPIEFGAPGKVSNLRLQGEKLTFCTGDQEYWIELSTPERIAHRAEAACAGAQEPDSACAHLGATASVRTPIGLGDDIVDLAAGSVPLSGHVIDCDGFSQAVAIATASRVLVINPKDARSETVSSEGADRIAIDENWLAWARADKIYAVRRKAGD